MSVNQMDIYDVYTVLNQIHEATTGTGMSGGATPEMINPANFVSVANTMFQNGPDVVYNALMNVITRTIFSARPYSRQFKGLIVDTNKWGAITRKIQFGDTDAVQDSAFSGLPANGQSVDHYIINRGDVVETRYYGSAEYQDVVTTTRDQLYTAFRSAEELGSFLAAKTTEVNNKWVQWTEDLVRGLVVNAIAAKDQYYDLNHPEAQHCLHLLTEYNTATGATPALTLQDVMKPANAKPFWEFVRARIRSLQRDFTNRNVLHYENISGHKVIRHTPYNKQKVYLSAVYMDLMETSTLTEAFNNDYLKYADYEGVAYWQDPYWPNTYRVYEYTYLDPGTGQYGVGDSSEGELMSDVILGLVFDEDFMSVNIQDTIVQNTPMNARGLYFDTWLTANARYLQDFTEKCTLLKLD